jgi:predicted Fe-Mo cluster-binding NifX family protein
MKIGMPKEGDFINQHFGQSRQFLIATVQDGQVVDKKVVGAESLQHNHAGLSGLFANEGVSVVITGGIGQPAYNALREKGLEVVRGASGTCEEVLQKYLRGEQRDSNVSCEHHGENHHHLH